MSFKTDKITLDGATYSSQLLPSASANVTSTLPSTTGELVNTNSTQNISGKTFSSCSFDAPTFLNYSKLQEVGSGTVPNPTADTAHIYLNIGDGLPHIRFAGPAEDVFTLNGTAATLIDKTLSNATISSLTTAITIPQGGTGATDASTARGNLGIGTLGTQNANNIAATGGTISGVSFSANFIPNFISFASAGTAPALSGYLTLFKDGLTDIFKYNTPSGTVRELVNTNLPQTLSSKTITSSAVSGSNLSGNTITGGTISGLSSDLAITDGGTGASNATDARANLGLGSLALQSGNAVAITGGNINDVVFSNPEISNLSKYNAITAASISTPVAGKINLFFNSDTNTLSYKNSSGTVIELSTLTLPVSVAQGGTGATDASTARTNLGLGSIATQDASNVALTGGTISGLSSLGVGGNLTISGNARRIIGDFSNNVTLANKLLFQSSTAGGWTLLGAIPNATGQQGGYIGYTDPDPDNSGFVSIYAGVVENHINTDKNGTGTTLALSFDYEDVSLMKIKSATLLEMQNGARIRSTTTSTHKFYLSAYDVDGAVNKDFITITSANTPTCDISAPSGATLTLGRAIATNFNLAAQSTPATPSSGLTVFAPSSGGTTILNYKDSAGTIHAVVDEQETQTLFNKTLFEVVVAGYRDSPTSKTSSATLQSSEGYVNNTGATGTITLTLPPSPLNGDKAVFRITTAQTVIVAPNSGKTLANASGTVVANIRSNLVNSMLALRYDNTVWATESLTGTWT